MRTVTAGPNNDTLLDDSVVEWSSSPEELTPTQTQEKKTRLNTLLLYWKEIQVFQELGLELKRKDGFSKQQLGLVEVTVPRWGYQQVAPLSRRTAGALDLLYYSFNFNSLRFVWTIIPLINSKGGRVP